MSQVIECLSSIYEVLTLVHAWESISEITAAERWRQKDQKFQVILNYIWSWMPFLDTKDPVFKEEEEKCNLYIRLVNLFYERPRTSKLLDRFFFFSNWPNFFFFYPWKSIYQDLRGPETAERVFFLFSATLSIYLLFYFSTPACGRLACAIVQGRALRSQFSPSVMWIADIELQVW